MQFFSFVGLFARFSLLREGKPLAGLAYGQRTQNRKILHVKLRLTRSCGCGRSKAYSSDRKFYAQGKVKVKSKGRPSEKRLGI